MRASHLHPPYNDLEAIIAWGKSLKLGSLKNTKLGCYAYKILVAFYRVRLKWSIQRIINRLSSHTDFIRTIPHKDAGTYLSAIQSIIERVETLSERNIIKSDSTLSKKFKELRGVLYRQEAILNKTIDLNETHFIPTEEYLKNGIAKLSSEAIRSL